MDVTYCYDLEMYLNQTIPYKYAFARTAVLKITMRKSSDERPIVFI
jgi:hypothetical protein